MGKENTLVFKKKKRIVTFMGLQKEVNKNISTDLGQFKRPYLK